MVENLPAVQETQVWSLGQEDLLGKWKATQTSILSWRIPWTEKTGRIQSMGSQRVGHDWTIFTFTFTEGLRSRKPHGVDDKIYPRKKGRVETYVQSRAVTLSTSCSWDIVVLIWSESTVFADHSFEKCGMTSTMHCCKCAPASCRAPFRHWDSAQTTQKISS